MITVGLTGGIGSGKSLVATQLGDRGAAVIDADVVARQVMAPGRPAYRGVLDRFGPGVQSPDGTIDRPALAAIVFADPLALADLNALTHPAVRDAMLARLAAEAGGAGRVAILDIPLLAEGARARWPLDGVIVVDASPAVVLERLVNLRGMEPGEALARMSSQASREDRLAIADFVIANSGDEAQLAAQVDRAWAWVTGLQP
ncbi:MAG: dephospho-CoA kinase [Acidimicrobiales bacterium]